jgi:phosphoserine aminotransferase
MIPLNLMSAGKSANYILTGSWGKSALTEAKREGETHVCWDGKSTGYDRLPADSEVSIRDDAAYVHYTSNETIEGVQFQHTPPYAGKPLVCDASSDFLSRPISIADHGIVYACAQKNAGPAGVTVVIIRKELVAQSPPDLHSYLSYRVHAENDSMMNTPPTFAIYLLNLITRWLLNDIGGLEAMARLNEKKASVLYDCLDASEGFYRGHSQPDCRSRMNVTFRLANDDIEKKFLSEASKRGLVTLKGHRSVGGIRASIYNAMPMEGVVALRDFMTEFRAAN